MKLPNILSWKKADPSKPKTDSEKTEDSFNYDLFRHFLNDTNFGLDLSSNPTEYNLAKHGYIRNPIVFRCTNIIARTASNINLHVMARDSKDDMHNICSHPLCELIARPNPFISRVDFIERIIYDLLIFGNAFIMKIKQDGKPKELYVLSGDNVEVLVDTASGQPTGYRLNNTNPNAQKDYMINQITGECDILHIKNYHPLNSDYGLSPLHAAANHIEQHNNSASWNNSLLRNGIKPSGVFSLAPQKNSPSTASSTGALTAIQMRSIIQKVEMDHTGVDKAGLPLVLNGQLAWHDLGAKQRDFDFLGSDQITTKHIANALGVPIQLLGETGSSSYNNMLEAKRILYENTVLPLLNKIIDNLFNCWLCQDFASRRQLFVVIKEEEIPALSYRLEQTLEILAKSDFMTVNEKRARIKLSPL